MTTLKERFTEALQHPPLSFLDRIGSWRNAQVWLMGTGTRKLIEELLDDERALKALSVCSPDQETVATRVIEESKAEYNRFQGKCLSRFESYPAEAFDICLQTWMMGTVPPKKLIRQSYMKLKDDGVMGTITMGEQTPEKPLALFRSELEEELAESFSFPQGDQKRTPKALRKQIYQQGFEEVTFWSNTFPVRFLDASELFQVMFQAAGEEVWHSLSEAQRTRIRTRFCNRVNKEYKEDFEVEYEYLAGLARVHSS